MKLVQRLVLTTLLSGAALSAIAQTDPPPRDGPPDGQRRQPPAAAIAACKDKAEGTKVTFTGRRGEVEGVCTRRGDLLVAVPDRKGMPPPPPAK